MSFANTESFTRARKEGGGGSIYDGAGVGLLIPGGVVQTLTPGSRRADACGSGDPTGRNWSPGTKVKRDKRAKRRQQPAVPTVHLFPQEPATLVG